MESKIVLILGAGGIARTVAHALHRERAIVTIVSRTLERAQKLAAEVGCRQAEWEAHAAFMDALADRGVIVAGGPLGREDEAARVLHICELPDESAVEALVVVADPWTPMRMLTTVSIDPWTVLLGGLSSG